MVAGVEKTPKQRILTAAAVLAWSNSKVLKAPWPPGPEHLTALSWHAAPVSNPEPGRTKEYGGVVHDGHGVADTCSLTSHRRLSFCAKITVSTSCRCQGYKLLLPDLWRFVALSDIRQDTQAKTYVLRTYHTPQVQVALQAVK